MRLSFLLLLVCAALSFGACTRVEVALTTTEQASTDDLVIRNYLISKNITDYIRTPNGNYVVIDSACPGNPYMRNGDFAYLRYRGYLPGSESIAFDSNTVDSATSLLRVELGRSGTVILGFQEGLRFFRVFEKGRLFIPSGQGYGATGSGTIPANQVLIFNIDIKKVQ